MGAGKGYLTFAVADYLANTLHSEAETVGVELRPDMVQLCNATAGKAGLGHLSFAEGSIDGYDSAGTSVLIALHACDTATDDAIAKGIAADAELIVVAPCCHKQIRREIETANAPTPLDYLLRHGIFVERQAEMVTDGIRALILEYFGYSTKVFEFISDQHTPKNVLIVGQRTGASASAIRRSSKRSRMPKRCSASASTISKARPGFSRRRGRWAGACRGRAAWRSARAVQSVSGMGVFHQLTTPSSSAAVLGPVSTLHTTGWVRANCSAAAAQGHAMGVAHFLEAADLVDDFGRRRLISAVGRAPHIGAGEHTGGEGAGGDDRGAALEAGRHERVEALLLDEVVAVGEEEHVPVADLEGVEQHGHFIDAEADGRDEALAAQFIEGTIAAASSGRPSASCCPRRHASGCRCRGPAGYRSGPGRGAAGWPRTSA